MLSKKCKSNVIRYLILGRFDFAFIGRLFLFHIERNTHVYLYKVSSKTLVYVKMINIISWLLFSGKLYAECDNGDINETFYRKYTRA